MELECLLSCSQEATAAPYPESGESTHSRACARAHTHTHTHTYVFKICCSIIFPSVFQIISSLQVFEQKLCIYFLTLPYVLHDLPL
jgi:hypothetical protein